ncbi:MAG: type II toxin-antitoxin system RelE/ParE family toxin [Acidipropionibacterium sp.]|jgi:plasmid stabilization system protein ParE|nr:type II toxin-antitoxin system RelE/ParE family toxin [Acidipropionibacterium sp.]
MTLTEDFHPDAEAELIAAATWYERERRRLGSDFLNQAEFAVQQLLDWPQIAPVFPGWDREPIVRSQAIKRFPFQIVYYVTDTQVRIVAFAHTRRKPGYWQDRLDG